MENISTGGYKILDLSAYGPFTMSVVKTVPGVSDFVKSNITKPILMTGAVVGTADVPAFFLNLRLDTSIGGYVGHWGTGSITINLEDGIIFAV